MTYTSVWHLSSNNLYNSNGNNNINKALNLAYGYPKLFWYIENNNVKTLFTKDTFQKAMTIDLDYPKLFWYIENNNVKTTCIKDKFQPALTKFDYEQGVLSYPKLFWYLQNVDNRNYLNNGFHNIHPFKAMTKMDLFVKTYPKLLWQEAEYWYYDYTLSHPINPDPELLGAFCHAKNISELNIKGNVKFGEFPLRESGINTIKLKNGKNIESKEYSFKENTNIIHYFDN